MAEYDTSIRVSTKVDSSELDKVAKTFKDIEGNADNAKDKVEELDKAATGTKTEEYEKQAKAIEKVNTELDKNIKKQKEAVQAQTESPDYRSAWTEEEEARIDALIAKNKEQKELAGQNPETEATREVTFDWKSNAEQQAQTAQQVEEIAAEMERAKAGIADADQHMNQLRVDVEEYAATLKELEAQGQYFGDDDYDQVYIAWRNATDDVKEYEANLRDLTDKGMAETEARIAKEEQINAKKREQEEKERKLQSIRVNAQVSNQKLVDLLAEQIRLQERLAELKKAGLTAGYQEYDNITSRLKQIKEQVDYEQKGFTKKREQEAEEQKLQSIRVNAQVSNQKLVDLLAEQIRLQERLAELKKAGLTAGYQEYDNITARLKQIRNQVDYEQKGFQKMGESGKKAFNKINTHARKSGGLLSTLGSRLKGIALSLLIFNWITKGFNAMVSGMKTGFNNLVRYSSDYNAAMSQLKSSSTQLQNSLATAFAPIVQMAIPYLVQLINYITMAANKVAQFMAILQGKSTWTKATAVQEDYAASLDGTSKSAKKAAGALASFDTLEVLSKKDSGSGSGGTSPKDMFEEVKTDDQAPETKFAKRIKDAIDKEDWFELGRTIGEKIAQSLDDIDWDSIYNKADRFGTGIADFLNGLISPALFYNLGKTIANSINTALHFLNSFGKEFDWKNFGKSLAAGIKGFFENWDAGLTGETLSTFAKGLLEAATAAVDKLREDETFKDIGQKLVDFLCGIDWVGLVWDLTQFFKACGDALIDFPVDFAEGVAQGILDHIFGEDNVKVEIPDGIKETLGEEFLLLFLPWLGVAKEGVEIIRLIIQTIATLANKVSEASANISAEFEFLKAQAFTTWEEIQNWFASNVQPWFTAEQWLELFDGIYQAALEKWDEIKAWWADSAIVTWWDEDVAPWFTAEKWLEVTQGILDGISGKWDELVAFWGPAIKNWWDTHVAPWFTAERWKTLGENMKKGIYNGFVGIVSKTVDIMNKIIAACESMINTVIDKINQFMQDAVATANKIPGVNFEAHTISHVQFGRVEMPDIPMLANGAVIRGGNPFAAILGDQPVGQTNIEAPLSTIEDAVRNVVGDRSGGVLNVNLNYDGETFARLSLQDFLNEMNRQGYDIDVLGGMS